MVESFSRTFVDWLNGRLAADVYVNASDATQAAAMKTWLRERPEVKAILPGARAEVQIGGSAGRSSRHPGSRNLSGSLAAAASQRQTPGSRLRAGDSGVHQRTTGAKLEARKSATPSRCRRRAETGSCSRRHLCGLRQSQGSDRGQYRRADRRFPEVPMTRMAPARRARQHSSPDRGNTGSDSDWTAATSWIRRR